MKILYFILGLIALHIASKLISQPNDADVALGVALIFMVSYGWYRMIKPLVIDYIEYLKGR